MDLRVLTCPTCGGSLQKFHAIHDNCQYCGQLIDFGVDTRPPEKPNISGVTKEEVFTRADAQTNTVPIEDRVYPRRGLYSDANFDTPVKPNRKLTALALVIIGFFAILFIYGFIQAFQVGERSELTNPELKIVAPTAVIQQVPDIPLASDIWWESEITSWLSVFDSAQLRETENAVNFVVFGRNHVVYAENQTFNLTDDWENKRPFFVEAAGPVTGTSVVVQVDDTQYTFNVYQPMSWKAFPNTVFMVDENADLWTLDLSKHDPELVNLSEVELPFTIEKNPDLELGQDRN